MLRLPCAPLAIVFFLDVFIGFDDECCDHQAHGKEVDESPVQRLDWDERIVDDCDAEKHPKADDGVCRCRKNHCGSAHYAIGGEVVVAVAVIQVCEEEQNLRDHARNGVGAEESQLS